MKGLGACTWGGGNGKSRESPGQDLQCRVGPGLLGSTPAFRAPGAQVLGAGRGAGAVCPAPPASGREKTTCEWQEGKVRA